MELDIKPRSYIVRVLNSLLFSHLIIIIILLIFLHSNAYALITILLYFIYNLLVCLRNAKYYITSIKLGNDLMELRFYRFNDQHNAKIEIEELEMYFGEATYVTLETYSLSFYQKEKLIVKQYAVCDWTYDKIIKMTESLKKYVSNMY